MADYPFLRSEFLQSLEQSGACSDSTGWQPMHRKLQVDDKQFFMPLYLKEHSWGEYVFDWAWADAYQRAGLNYYPKLLTAIPFTPAQGPRIGGDGLTRDSAQQMVEQTVQLAEQLHVSSWHLLFADQQQMPLLQNRQLLNRVGIQYHWRNRNYWEFDDFLATLTSRKRKMIRRERRQVTAQNITISTLPGEQIDDQLWTLFHGLYQRTYLKRSGNRGYLSLDFFKLLGKLMPEQLSMVVAKQEQQIIACSLFFHDQHQLYGRYWGSIDEYQFVHFELCYYRGIELAIDKGLRLFDAGAQGEHKIIRGFEPQLTHSLPWIADRQFRSAIDDFLQREHRAVEQHRLQAEALLPYKNRQD